MRNSWFSFLKKYPNVQSLCAAGAWPSPLRTSGLRAAGGVGRLPAPPPTSATVQRLGSRGYHQFSSSPAELVLPVAYKDISLMQGSRMMSTGILTPNSSDAEFPSDLLMPKRSMTDEERAQGLYQDLTMPVTNFHFEDKGLMVLAGDVFDIPMRKDIVHRVVRWQLAKRRQGTHSTKTISEVSGTGKKPYQQKGTGRARHGTLRGPQFRGGCVMHGPKPKSYEYKLNKKVRRMGLKVALSARAAEGKLVVLDDLEVMTHKTKNLVNWAQQMEGSKKILVVDGGPIKENLKLATQNLHYVNVLPSIGLNVYSILLHDTLVMSRDAVNRIVERMHTPINR